MKKQLFTSIVLYLLGLIFLSVYVVIEIDPNLLLYTSSRLKLLFTICLFLYFGGFFLSKELKNNTPMKVNLWIFFILYLLLLITLTLFDPIWGRHGIQINYSKEAYTYYLKNSMNLIPFSTISNYINQIFNSNLSTYNIFYNLVGNVVCLMPLGLFIPLLLKNKSFKKFIIITILITLGIELAQFITLSGHFDIDDLILNSMGALAAYQFLNIKDINKLIRNIFLLEKNRLHKKEVFRIMLSIFLVIVLILTLVEIRNIYYNMVNY